MIFYPPNEVNRIFLTDSVSIIQGLGGGFGKKKCKDRYSRREKSDHKPRRRFVAFMSRFCHFFDILVFIL